MITVYYHIQDVAGVVWVYTVAKAFWEKHFLMAPLEHSDSDTERFTSAMEQCGMTRLAGNLFGAVGAEDAELAISKMANHGFDMQTNEAFSALVRSTERHKRPDHVARPHPYEAVKYAKDGRNVMSRSFHDSLDEAVRSAQSQGWDAVINRKTNKRVWSR